MGSWSCSTSSGYLTATTALYVSRDTHELLGSMMPHRCGPSRPACSTVVVHSGIPNSSGAVAISRTASIAEIRQLATLRWLSVSPLKRRAREAGRHCVVVAAVQTSVCGAWHVEQTRNIRVILLARIRPEEGDKLGEPGRRKVIARVIQGASPRGRWRSFCLFAAAALPLDRPPGVCLWSPTNTISAGCWMAASAAIS